MKSSLFLITILLHSTASATPSLFVGSEMPKSNLVFPILREVEKAIDIQVVDQLKNASLESVTLNLFSDLDLDVIVENRTIFSSDEFELSGQVVNDEESYFYLGRSGEYVAIEVYAQEDEVHVVAERFSASSTATITQYDPIGDSTCGVSHNASGDFSELFSQGVASSPVTLRIVYGASIQLLAKYGNSLSRLEARMRRMIALANRIEKISGSMLRFELAAVVATGYDEGSETSRDPELEVDLARLLSGSDGLGRLYHEKMLHQAHVVGLLLEGVSRPNAVNVGIASDIGVKGQNAFFVLRSDFGDGFNTSHEVGHLLGLAHPENQGVTSYARGYYFGPIVNQKSLFSTVMNGPNTYKPIRRRSSPDAKWPTPILGFTIGDPETSDEVRYISETVSMASGWNLRPSGKFEFTNGNSEVIAQILSDGTCLFAGSVMEFSSANDLFGTSQSLSSFVITDDPNTVTIARLDSSGKLYLKQTCLHFRSIEELNDGSIPMCLQFKNNDGMTVAGFSTIGTLVSLGQVIFDYTGPWF